MLRKINHYWFKRAHNFLGWKPSSWQGWLTVVLFLVYLVKAFIDIHEGSHSLIGTLVSTAQSAIIPTIVLLTIFLWKKSPSR